MDSKVITVRTPVDLMARIDEIARRRHLTRSALIEQVLEEFIARVRERGYLIPPYEGDEILRDLHLNRRRQTVGRYNDAPTSSANRR